MCPISGPYSSFDKPLYETWAAYLNYPKEVSAVFILIANSLNARTDFFASRRVSHGQPLSQRRLRRVLGTMTKILPHFLRT